MSNDTSTANQQSKADLIAERQANLPLPEQAPVASDFNTADASGVNVGFGGVQSDLSNDGGSEAGLRGPATTDGDVRSEGGMKK